MLQPCRPTHPHLLLIYINVYLKTQGENSPFILQAFLSNELHFIASFTSNWESCPQDELRYLWNAVTGKTKQQHIGCRVL